jgi:hypothetical protein
MAQIYEPIKNHRIIFRYSCHGLGDNYKKIIEYNDEFKTIEELKAYFLRFPNAGYMVGYGSKTPEVPWALNAILVFEYTDQCVRGSNEFANVFAFIKFLEDHPPLAKCVGYVKKGPS